ncbi:hypothetical protein CVM50_00970 [Pseudooceanicola marinus]|nr:hypothetical protein CVM50_00970 [Pseudooceanicola marinus]
MPLQNGQGRDQITLQNRGAYGAIRAVPRVGQLTANRCILLDERGVVQCSQAHEAWVACA